jgi:hypothetical protein
MAKKTKGNDSLQNNSSSASSGAFIKGLVHDYDEQFDIENSWAYARNAVNNSIEGDLGVLGNEPSNLACGQAPYTITGRVHLFKQYWAIISTDDTDSEIGLFDETQCSYRTVVNDPCLNFSTLNLITGEAKENFDCSWSIYIADGRNPDRLVNLGNPDLWPTSLYLGNNYYANNELWPGVTWNKECNTISDCIICTNLNTLNCEEIRLNKIVNTPCIKMSAGDSGGNLQNGSYLATIAYSINEQKYGDYVSPSNVVSLFNHNNIAGSLEITISNLDTNSFTEFELVIISIVDQATVAKKIGIYNINETVTISLDRIDPSLPTVPLEVIPVQNPIAEKSNSIFQTSGYLIRVAPTSKFDFNYQPLSNQIEAEWVISSYPSNYYKNGGYVTGYMRDEVYSFFIRWIYNTGDKSRSYHIPGRAPLPGETDDVIGIYTDFEKRFDVENTASFTGTNPGISETEDGGIPIAYGKMGYWESTEEYPNALPQVWNASSDPALSGTNNPIYDLCGKPIRHHKIPEDIINNTTAYSRVTTDSNGVATNINIVGVRFKNIKPPVYRDEEGNIKVISGIVGYEILRGSRQGNKSVIAKGVINNMRRYQTATNDEGLYPNYPYNPIVAQYAGGPSGVLDPTLSLTPVDAAGDNVSVVGTAAVSKNYFTFHSPDTSFYNPYLLAKELRLYTELGQTNNVTGYFEEVPGHPKHKILTDLSLIVSVLIGAGEAVLAMKGKTTLTTDGPRILNIGLAGTTVGGSGAIDAPNIAAGPSPAALGTLAGSNLTINTAGFLSNLLGGDFANSIIGLFEPTNAYYTAYIATDAGVGVLGRARGMTNEQSGFDSLPTIFKSLGGIVTFTSLTSTAASNNLDLIEALVKFRQYAMRYVSHGYLHRDSVGNVNVTKRTRILDSGYLNNQFNTFDSKIVNNLYRSSTVAIKTNDQVFNPALVDTSIASIGTNLTGGGVGFTNPTNSFKTTASCYYTGMKVRYRNQYGQLQSIEQIPLNCPITQLGTRPANALIPNSVILADGVNQTLFLETYESPVLYGGDTYIGRYTEKNTFFYFSDWLYNQPDGTAFDYTLRYLGLYPKYWVNLGKYELEGFLGSIIGNLSDPSLWNTPANTNNLDGNFESNSNLGLTNFGQIENFRFSRKDAYFYLFQSGVKDFFVESEINVDQRDWGELPEEQYYPVISGLSQLFDTPIIKSGNYFKINPSVSVYRLFSSIISWGAMQDRGYDPTVAALCFQYSPNRLLYSLPDNLENKKDFWQVFLANNYRDFKNNITAVKSIGKNGAIILFANDSPLMFQGTETLNTDIGTKITIGDGALFSQPLQSLVNSDLPYEYGSCQDKFSVINTPAGIYWMSPTQGKIFTISQGIDEISSAGLRWWFSKFMPYRLLIDFPEFEVTDNPVAGVGMQSIYDNDDALLYFCKKDYELKKDLPAGVVVEYNGGVNFSVNRAKIKLGDPRYFNDVSWTVSYDPKIKAWLSYHDWHPDLSIPTRVNFITTKGGTMWRHNFTTNSYCNFYGQNYPFQVEYVMDTGQTVNTLRNLEYLLEAYIYDLDGIDRFHVLDFNFDHLVVYNTEQVSGQLNLNLAPKNDPFARLNYPQINPDSIDIAYDKVEQKYRINQFWDITADRGEYNPNVQRPIWLTGWDGYKRQLNPANLNYNKSEFERKKFRHYFANTLFSKDISGNVKMLMKIINNKNLNSPR